MQTLILGEQERSELLRAMEEKFGSPSKERIVTGISQVLNLWTQETGDFADLKEFCLTYFIADKKQLAEYLQKLELVFEKLEGHLTEIETSFSWWKDVELGEFTAHDAMLAEYFPARHVSDDFFAIKLPFAVLLNFKQEPFESIVKNCHSWDRKKWVEVNITNGFSSRVPASVSNASFLAVNEADKFVNSYNIYVNRLRTGNDNKPFLYATPRRLISHWSLRDEIKSCYLSPSKDALARQELIFKTMEHIVKGTIPKDFVDNSVNSWDPYSQKYYDAENREIVSPELSHSHRYEYWLNIFKATKESDVYHVYNKTLIARRFNENRKIPEAKIEELLRTLLASPLLGKTTKLIERRLGRSLRPFDIWYPGFLSGSASGLTPEKLNKAVKDKFPTAAIFQEKIPAILVKLGFSRPLAKEIAALIEVNPSRSAGHARPGGMRGAKALLRVRTNKGKLDYESFNVAMHELGHTVEQVISHNMIDSIALCGVPNNAFTEAIAFVFQKLDLTVLGFETSNKPSKEKAALHALDTFYKTCEIGSMALVDMYTWRYLYAHPHCSAEDLRCFVVEKANALWSEFWASHLGESDAATLGIYSHMLNNLLYLPDYPLGHIISYQIETFFETHALAPNLLKMCKLGNIYPELWLEKAVGTGISVEYLTSGVEKALKILE